MLAEERFALILEQLNEQRTVTVQQLCEALHTSESTIRRDLTELDRQPLRFVLPGCAPAESSPSSNCPKYALKSLLDTIFKSIYNWVRNQL